MITMGTVVLIFGDTDGRETGGWKKDVIVVFREIAV